MKTIILFLSIFFLSIPNLIFAQVATTPSSDSAQLFLIVKNDGTEYIGKILSDDGREVLIETENLGKIYIPKSDIKSMKKIDREDVVAGGVYNGAGPFTTRYCFTTNALPIVKGENYLMTNLYGPEVHFALSNNFSLGIMSTWIASPLVLAAKYSFRTKKEKLNFSVGTLFGTSGYLNSFRGFGGLHFANVTIGDRTRNLTFSAGYAYVKGGFRSNIYEEGTYYYDGGTSPSYFSTLTFGNSTLASGPIFSVAGIIKVGAKASFVFDSMFGVFSQEQYVIETTELTPPDYNANPSTPGTYKTVISKDRATISALLIMPGMRFQTQEDRAFQVSLAGVVVARQYGGNSTFPFPMCSWFRKF